MQHSQPPVHHMKQDNTSIGIEEKKRKRQLAYLHNGHAGNWLSICRGGGVASHSRVGFKWTVVVVIAEIAVCGTHNSRLFTNRRTSAALPLVRYKLEIE